MFLYITQSMVLLYVGMERMTQLVNSKFRCQVEAEELLIP